VRNEHGLFCCHGILPVQGIGSTVPVFNPPQVLLEPEYG
jgi:hypothetical protein